MRYTKKPVTIEAIQMTPTNRQSDEAWPAWLLAAVYSENRTVQFRNNEIVIETLEGVLTVDVDDFIIQGLKGELYPCKPDIFALSYDEATS
jgi:hypothetical protein